MGEKDIYEADASNGFDLNQEASNSPGDSKDVEYNLANSHDQLERGLKSRHVQFLALGKTSWPPPPLPPLLTQNAPD